MIKASHLSKNFGDITALSDVSFEIGKGEVVGLLGPNGAGKTTAMRILTGYLAPSSGSVSIDDLDITKNSLAIKKKIGYLPENNPLYTDQLVFEYLEFAARIKGLFKDKSKKAIQKAVSETGIAEVYYRPIGELSKGYCQRVGLAQALLGNPEILIFDEPTEGLDPNQRVEIRSLIKNLGKDKTIILSTHVMQEASAVCDRIIIINIGKIVADKNSLELGKTDIITVELTLSGNDAYEKIKAIQGIVAIDSRETRDDKEKLTINIGKGGNFERNLAKLCCENDLIIWELFRKEKGLEEIFRELTEAKP